LSVDAGVSVNGEDREPRNGEIAVLKVSSVSSMVFNPRACKPVIKDELHRVAESPRKRHVIVSRSNTPNLVGACALVDKDYPDLFLSDKLWQLKLDPNANTSPEWLASVLSSPAIRHRLAHLATGTSSSMKNISKDDLLSLPIGIPHPAEQSCIAETFAAWDRSISLTERLIAAKLTLRKGLMQQLLTGKRRFPGFSEPWRDVRLGDVFGNRIEINCIELPLVAITGKEGVIYRDQLDRKDTSNEDKSKYLRIAPGDIGYNTMRMWQGVCGLSAIEGIVSPAYTIVTPTTKIAPEFAALMFKSAPMIHWFYRYSQGLVDDTLSLKYPQFAKIPIKLPTRDEQERIASAFAPIDRELLLLRSQLAALKTQKRGLMQQLLTGKVRVQVADAAA
jgi:type I restriction enzyme S subunit